VTYLVIGDRLQGDVQLSQGGPLGRGVWATIAGSLTLPYAGYYVLYAECQNSASATAQDPQDNMQIRIGVSNYGIQVNGPASHAFCGGPAPGSWHVAFGLVGPFTAGQYAYVDMFHNANSPSQTRTLNPCYLRYRFVPNQTYRR
jgi:hypothetical protein